MSARVIYLPRRAVRVEWSPIAGCLVVREHGPASPAILALRMAGRFLASMAGAFAITIAVAVALGAFR